MSREYYECAKNIGKRGGFWKFVAGFLFIGLVIMTISALLIKLENIKYKDVLVKQSESFPNTPEQEKKLAEIRKNEWAKAHSRANRKSCEDRLFENRVTEEE